MNPYPHRRRVAAFAVLITLCCLLLTGSMVIGLMPIEAKVRRLIDEDQALELATSRMMVQQLRMRDALRTAAMNPADSAAFRNLALIQVDFSQLLEEARQLSEARETATAQLREVEILRRRQESVHAAIIGLARHDTRAALRLIDSDETPLSRQMVQNLIGLGKSGTTGLKRSLKVQRDLVTALTAGGVVLLMVMALLYFVLGRVKRLGDVAGP
jgi:hypothetical protein